MKSPEQKEAEQIKFEPYIKANEKIPEVTLRAVILGMLLTLLFGAANAYLGLKVGMTVSASIPASVISMSVLRVLFRKNKGTVLENNIVQSIGSAGESLAAGIIFTIPAFYIWNQTIPGFSHPISNLDVVFLSILGGTLGILFMIPLRRYLIVKEHGKLKFPEGTACAEIIKAGDKGGSKAKHVFMGMGFGALYKVLMSGFRIWPEGPNYNLPFLKGGNVGITATPALLGVGYIIGPRTSALMLAGAVLGYLGIAPLIAYLGQHIPAAVPPATKLISDMTPGEIRDNFIKYLGVGAVVVGGFVSLIKSIPTIVHSFKVGAQEIFGRKKDKVSRERTDQDIPMSVVLIGTLVVILALFFYPSTQLSILGTALIVVFGFFFVVVAARIVGIVGSSSSPVSGMTLATILATSLILLAFGISGFKGMVTVMTIGTVVCLAVCMSGDISQDLKTGFLLGGTPRHMQTMTFLGLVFPALFMGLIIQLLDKSFGFVASAAHPTPLLAPQANVMATIVKGVMTGGIPWVYIMVGMMLAFTVELLGIGSLPFAIGLYLPLDLSTPIMAGGLVSLIVRKTTSKEHEHKDREENGILFGSGLVAGDALVGLFIAFVIAGFSSYEKFYTANEAGMVGSFGPWLALICFAVITFFLWNATRLGKPKEAVSSRR